MTKENKNEALLKRIRESKVQGPFNLELKVPGHLLFFPPYKPFAYLLTRWEGNESFESPQELADYLEEMYLGKGTKGADSFELAKERASLTGRLVLKLKDLQHLSEVPVPQCYTWLKIKPKPYK
jgi:hypothetical protein